MRCTSVRRLVLSGVVIWCIPAVPPLTAQGRRVPGIIHDPGIHGDRTDLSTWTIQSSAQVGQTGDVISKPGYDSHTWYSARVPTTVLNALVQDGIYPDPTYDVNFKTLPGAFYDASDNFLVDPAPPENPFLVPWWYRTEIRLRTSPGSRLW